MKNQGGLNSRRPTESVSEFLTRLPPSTTKEKDIGPWIWAHSPHDSSTDKDVSALQRRGLDLLYAFENEKTRLEAEYSKAQPKAKSTVGLARKLNPLRRRLEEDLFALARETGVVGGKWMLFVSVEHVDEIWAAVAGATGKGNLGSGAKVATGDGSGARRARLICVYTDDFDDREDVKRVLVKLRDLGLVGRGDRPIYYKCDAFTYLEVNHDNPYGLRASLFSSRDFQPGKV